MHCITNANGTMVVYYTHPVLLDCIIQTLAAEITVISAIILHLQSYLYFSVILAAFVASLHIKYDAKKFIKEYVIWPHI